jgi:hypothetical protein
LRASRSAARAMTDLYYGHGERAGAGKRRRRRRRGGCRPASRVGCAPSRVLGRVGRWGLLQKVDTLVEVRALAQGSGAVEQRQRSARRVGRRNAPSTSTFTHASYIATVTAPYTRVLHCDSNRPTQSSCKCRLRTALLLNRGSAKPPPQPPPAGMHAPSGRWEGPGRRTRRSRWASYGGAGSRCLAATATGVVGARFVRPPAGGRCARAGRQTQPEPYTQEGTL